MDTGEAAIVGVTPAVETVTPEEKMGPIMSVLVFLLAIYVLACASLAVVGIYDVYFHDLTWFRSLRIPLPATPSALMDLKAALLAGLGASLGASLLCFLGFFNHAVLGGNFKPGFFGSYIIGPWAVIFLGFGAFVLVRAGLLVFGNVQDITDITKVNELSYLAFGILVGYSWNRVLAKFSELAQQAFSTSGRPIRLRVRPPSIPLAGADQT